MSAGLSGRFRQAGGVVMREIAGETLLVPLQQTGAEPHRIFALNATAAAAWALLTEPRTLQELVEGLRKSYEGPPDVIAEDIEELLREMLERGFVTSEADDE